MAKEPQDYMELISQYSEEQLVQLINDSHKLIIQQLGRSALKQELPREFPHGHFLHSRDPNVCSECYLTANVGEDILISIERSDGWLGEDGREWIVWFFEDSQTQLVGRYRDEVYAWNAGFRALKGSVPKWKTFSFQKFSAVFSEPWQRAVVQHDIDSACDAIELGWWVK